MKILMLINWNIKYSDKPVENEQPMNFLIKNEPYWFFKYFENIPEVDIIDTHSFSIVERFEKYKLRFYIIQALKAIPRMKNYDLIISHGMQSGIVCALFRRVFKSKNKHLVFDVGTFNSGAENGSALKLMQYASKSIDGLIYHSSWQKSYYHNFYPWIENKSYFIPLGIDPSILGGHIKRYDALDRSSPYFLCIGKDRCDWQTVADAYAGIDTDTRLCFLGGVDKSFFDRKNVLMIPYVSFEEMLDLIQCAQFCLLPIENVKFSFGQIRLLQQMAMGKCVVVPKTISLSDYGIDKETVLFYVPGDVFSCREAIKLALNSQSLREIIGKRASEEVNDKFTERKMAHRIEKTIVSLMSK